LEDLEIDEIILKQICNKRDGCGLKSRGQMFGTETASCEYYNGIAGLYKMR